MAGNRTVALNLRLDRYLYFELESNGRSVADRVVRNFWLLLYGLLSYSDQTLQAVDGRYWTIRITGDISHGGYRRIYTCAETQEVAFNAFGCQGIEDLGQEDGWNSYASGDISVFEVWKTPTKDANSSALAFGLFDTYGWAHTVLMSHAVGAIYAYQTFKHKLVAKVPFLYNLIAIIGSIYLDNNVPTAVDMGGNTFNPGGVTVIAGGAASIVLGTGTKGVSPADYTLTNPVQVKTAILGNITDTYAEIDLYGYLTPTDDMTATEIGIMLPVRDSGGGVHNTLIFRYLLSSPLTFKAGKLYTIKIVLYGS